MAGAIRAESWKDDRRDVRCKMYDVRGLTGVGSLVFYQENIRNYENPVI
jgi:hypothetical protein